jgi:hypothetical protein
MSTPAADGCGRLSLRGFGSASDCAGLTRYKIFSKLRETFAVNRY